MPTGPRVGESSCEATARRVSGCVCVRARATASYGHVSSWDGRYVYVQAKASLR
jgi:hypothetical protein